MGKDGLAERRAALLHAGVQVSRNITSILDLDVLLQKTVDVICEAFGFYYAGVFLLDASGEWAVLHAGHGDAGAAMVAEGHKLRVGGLSMIGAATGRNTALIALDVGEEAVHFKNPHLPLTRSEMALPLAIGDDVIGALTVQSVEEAAFSEDDIAALQSMADQLAVAIRNARLYTENAALLAQAERRARLLAAASAVGKSVTSILDLDELLAKTVDIICEAYGFYYAGIFLLDDTGEWAVLRAGHGPAGAAMVAEGHKLRVGGLSMIGASIAERKARIALDVGEEAVFFKNPHLPETRSEMALPLVAGDDVIGALTVQSVEEAAFSDEDISSLQAMADQLAVALDNAHLLRALEIANAELVRTKTFEAIATATTEAIHWIGNKAMPITVSVRRLREDLDGLNVADADTLESMREDLMLIEGSAQLIVQVQEHLIGPAREYAPAPAMIDDVVHDVVQARVHAMEIAPGVVSFNVAPNLPLGIVDTTQLSRAVGYVLENAVEATADVAAPQIGVEIGVAEEKGRLYVVTTISDNGPGIPEDLLDKIWVSFFTTKGAKHAGLGLSACLQIAKQLDGKATGRNLPEGGAAFEIWVPVAAVAEPGVSLPSGKHILLVDDDDAWSRFVERVLVDAQNTVYRTTDVVDAGTLAEFDVILVDKALATANVAALLKKIGKAGAGAKTTVVASSVRVEQTMALLRYGARDVVIKPYTPAALAALLGS